ncbi:MAG: glycosyltransferase family 39 protein [Acidimicrobiia bacterium]
MRATETDARPPTVGSRSSFARWLVVVTLAALVLRVVVVALASRDLPFGDAIWYDLQSHLIADGHGFISPGHFLAGSRIATAEHPPLFPFLLALVNWSGHGSVLAHQVACACMGAAGVAAMGLAGRAVAGPRVGIAAAVLAAIVPNVWQYDALGLSESLLPLGFGLFVLALYRLHDDPSLRRAVALGTALAFATYIRTEMVLLVVFVVPLVLRTPAIAGAAARARVLAVVGLVAMALIAPWTIRNLSVFDRTVLFTDNTDSVIGGANCDAVYHGSGLGSWAPKCNNAGLPRGDESVAFAELRHRGIEYATDHLDRVPIVVAARVGRAWEVFRPFQHLGEDGRPDSVWITATVTFFLLLGVGAVGTVQLHRRGRIVWPLLGMAPFVTVLAAVGYGLPRLRLQLDLALILLAAVPVERAWCRARLSAAKAQHRRAPNARNV